MRRQKLKGVDHKFIREGECEHLQTLITRQEVPSNLKAMDDILFSEYLAMQKDNKPFYEQSSVSKLIDRQFQGTKDLYFKLMYFLIAGYIVPLIGGLFVTEPTIKIVLFSLGAITQIFFFGLEVSELIQAESGYLTGWNLNDFSMPFIYGSHVGLFYIWNLDLEENQHRSLFYNIITIVTLLQAVLKTLQYVRIIDSFGFLVQMIISVFADLVPFLVILLIFVCFFSLMVFVMGGEFDNGDYDGITVKYIYYWI